MVSFHGRPGRVEVVFDHMQSEEGGRFYHEANRNIIALAPGGFPCEPRSGYMFMTIYQLKEFIKYNNYLNVEARSLLSCLSMV